MLGRQRSIAPEAEALVRELRAEGPSYPAIADALNAAGIPTAQGGARWYPGTVRLIALRVAA